MFIFVRYFCYIGQSYMVLFLSHDSVGDITVLDLSLTLDNDSDILILYQTLSQDIQSVLKTINNYYTVYT